ncbi:hypothetical protein Cyast_0551 [Cyanobacterium stanieri PCC 7202]|uniref:Lipoprotein n=1 Tax=Cyanobacterium stanieri (strain ATCC 29140 / PCC 7202) TaxID=292563 RepID=K9YI48_CYASC|nr:hypothetical protein Cyast_0551 [Cyanobacterium stanieri PCC 7202]
MNKISILFLSSLILLGGCTIPTEEDDFSTSFPPPTPVEEPDDDLDDVDPSVVGTVGGIIPSTDPTNRLRQIQEGRNDPFALPTPRVSIQRVPVPDAETAVNGTTPSAPTPTPGPNGVTPGQPGVNGVSPGVMQPDGSILRPDGVVVQPDGSIVRPDGTVIPPDANGQLEPPPPPPPTFAERIVISGVMDMEGQRVAIISTPEGGSTRSVRVGESIMGSDGMVMVRAININRPSGQSVRLKEDLYFVDRNLGAFEGSVVFEEMGKQVVRRVGEMVPDGADNS